jgi:hypothetical protein
MKLVFTGPEDSRDVYLTGTTEILVTAERGGDPIEVSEEVGQSLLTQGVWEKTKKEAKK